MSAAYVAERRKYALKQQGVAEAAFARVVKAAEAANGVAHQLYAAREARKQDPSLPAVELTDEQISAIALVLQATEAEKGNVLMAWQVVQELALGLDEAVVALDYYAADATWVEVPPNTPAAADLGQRAKLALFRIDPV